MPLKLTLGQVQELLTQAGVPAVEIVDTDDQSDYTTTAKTDKPVTQDSLLMAIDASRETIIGPKIIQSKTGEIHTSVAGKINGSLRSQISQLTGIPLSEIKDMDSKEAMKAGLDFYGKTFGADKEAIKREMDSLMDKHSKAIADRDTEWKGKLDGVTAKLTEKEIIAKLVKDHNEAKGLPPTANKVALAKQFKSYLDGTAIVKYNEEKDEIELYDKKNPDIRLYTNDNKTTYAKPSDFMKPHYSDLGIWNEDNRNINPADALKNTPQQGYIPPTKGPDGKIVNPVDAGNAAMLAYAESVKGK